MIENIIFDIGNVLATFNPKSFLHKLLDNPSKEDLAFQVLFGNPDLWNKYDQGVYSTQDVIDIATKKVPELKKEIELILINWVKYVLPISSSMDLIEKYKDTYSLYILSNIPKDNYIYISTHYEYIHKMKGGIYSYQYKLIKPDPRLFKLLLEEYNLKADKCLFIDDKLENVESAKQLGFHTIHLTDYRELPKLLEEYLNEM